MKRRLMWIAWPAFLVAGAMEVVVFALVDPHELHGLDGEPLSRHAIYSIAFFGFWGATMVSSALTTLLSVSPFEVDRCTLPRGTRPDVCRAPQGGD